MNVHCISFGTYLFYTSNNTKKDIYVHYIKENHNFAGVAIFQARPEVSIEIFRKSFEKKRSQILDGK